MSKIRFLLISLVILTLNGYLPSCATSPSFESSEKEFLELFDMEVQNRAFALKACANAKSNASTEGDKTFFGAWLEFEEFLQKEYAPFATKYSLSQAPRSMAKIQAGLVELANNILPDSVLRTAMRDQTVEYLKKLKRLRQVAPKEDAEFFDFVVEQEEVQIDALQFWIDEKYDHAAKLLRDYINKSE